MNSVILDDSGENWVNLVPDDFATEGPNGEVETWKKDVSPTTTTGRLRASNLSETDCLLLDDGRCQ